MYESGAYAPGRELAERLPSGLRSLLDGDRIRLLGTLPEEARVIEIGAGRGRMVAALQRRGCDATGIEPSATARAAAR
ncbi:MAG: class I SAM-dependent methyltransferase, partial [Solirubrobacterales bacterium]